MADEPTTEIVKAEPTELAPVVGTGADVVVLARDPQEMAHAQQGLIDWFQQKILAEKAQLAECEENLAVAVRLKTRTNGWKNQVVRAKRKVLYYEKGLQALQEGYYIVPEFPLQIIAVRTDKKNPPGKVYTGWQGVPDVEPAQLPEGEGRYVDSAPLVRMWTTKQGDDPKTQKTHRRATDFVEDFDFPFKLVKPQVLKDLDRAMRMRLFDEIGVLPARARNTDPMVVGRIRCKHGPYERTLSFLITWWIDTRDL